MAPYKSRSQQRYFHAAEARGEMDPKTVKEYDKASKGKHLPEKVKGSKFSRLKKMMKKEK